MMLTYKSIQQAWWGYIDKQNFILFNTVVLYFDSIIPLTHTFS